jgi:hypothetical protein
MPLNSMRAGAGRMSFCLMLIVVIKSMRTLDVNTKEKLFFSLSNKNKIPQRKNVHKNFLVLSGFLGCLNRFALSVSRVSQTVLF